MSEHTPGNDGPGPVRHDPDKEHRPLSRGRFDEGQASEEAIEDQVERPHGRYDEGERGAATAEGDLPRGRYDEGQASEETLEDQVDRPHGRYDEGERGAKDRDTRRTGRSDF
ncbi:hypothetical protein [Georgenia sp. SYP-B2076]|uniref:hypothetical protein n=1 Tax=Georgenia sp. SYP-B2076 TaxID=2495881 RepID=UPI000F8E2314|nr:hypothetical protein [Georgenia sp. SYP-B2076]